jgi:hypothetical protein
MPSVSKPTKLLALHPTSLGSTPPTRITRPGPALLISGHHGGRLPGHATLLRPRCASGPPPAGPASGIARGRPARRRLPPMLPSTPQTPAYFHHAPSAPCPQQPCAASRPQAPARRRAPRGGPPPPPPARRIGPWPSHPPLLPPGRRSPGGCGFLATLHSCDRSPPRHCTPPRCSASPAAAGTCDGRVPRPRGRALRRTPSPWAPWRGACTRAPRAAALLDSALARRPFVPRRHAMSPRAADARPPASRRLLPRAAPFPRQSPSLPGHGARRALRGCDALRRPYD